jgi:hypothetical protein
MHWTKTSVVVGAAGLLLGLPAMVAGQNPKETGGGGNVGARVETRSTGGDSGGRISSGGGGESMGSSSGSTGSTGSSGAGSSGAGWSGSPGVGASSFGGASASAVRPRDAVIRRPGFADLKEGRTDARNNSAGSSGVSTEAPWYSRPRGDAPASGNAILRTDYIAARPPGGGGGGSNPGWGDGGWSHGYPYYGSGYGGWYMYPAMWGSYGYGYPDCGYGAYGMGYFFYNPFGWNYYGNCGYYGGYGGSPFYVAPYGSSGPDYYSGGGGSIGYGSYQSRGGLRLKVNPTNARVYVDGYYAGKVDQFDGSRQKLEIERGKHKIEISALGYAPVVFEIEIKAYETITWEGKLEIVTQKIK